MALTEFLLARIAEDEERARSPLSDNHWQSIHPRRVLAECEAKRRIIELHRGGSFRPYPPDAPEGKHYHCFLCGAGEPCDTLRALALPYADHLDYREEW